MNGRIINRACLLFGWLSIFLLQLALLMPIISAGIVGDDLINPFSQFYETGPGLNDVFAYGFEAGTGHHFNVLGTVIGTIHTHYWLVFSSWFGTEHLLYYQITKFLTFSLSMLSASFFLWVFFRDLCKMSISFWKLYLLQLIIFASTVQIHSLWSNDPVANYPLSGYASAALGFLVLGLTLRYVSNPSKPIAFLIALTLVVAILYYAINVSLLPSVLVLLVFSRMFSSSVEDNHSRFGDWIIILAIPTIVTIYLRLHTSAESSNYGGTTFGTLDGFFKAWFVGLGSSIPTSSWNLVHELIPNLLINYWQLGLMGACLVGVSFSFALINKGLDLKPSQLRLGNLFVIFVALATYMIAAIAIQASTQKYQAELPRIGFVYNFYSISSLCITVFICAIYFWMLAKQRRLTLVFQATLIGLFAVQYVLNWTVSNTVNQVTAPSQALISRFGVAHTDSERCLAWTTWASGAWPDYYEEGMGNGLARAAEYYYGFKFCSEGTRPIL